LKTRKTLLQWAEYAMYGRVFKFEEDPANPSRVTAFASFGGLLMTLKATPQTTQHFSVDQTLYILLSGAPHRRR
jgi:hypothetical protein